MTWGPSDLEATSVTMALQQFYGLPTQYESRLTEPPVPIRSKKYDGNNTNRWYITFRTDDVSKVEIWVGDRDLNGGAGTPLYRLYPDPCREYC